MEQSRSSYVVVQLQNKIPLLEQKMIKGDIWAIRLHSFWSYDLFLDMSLSAFSFPSIERKRNIYKQGFFKQKDHVTPMNIINSHINQKKQDI